MRSTVAPESPDSVTDFTGPCLISPFFASNAFPMAFKTLSIFSGLLNLPIPAFVENTKVPSTVTSNHPVLLGVGLPENTIEESG